MAKILLMSHCLPPVPYGPSFVLARLFDYFPKDSLVVYTTEYKSSSSPVLSKFSAAYHYAPAHSCFEDYSAWTAVREWLEVIPMVKRGLKIIKSEKIKSLLVCPTSGNFLLAAYIMHKITKLPLNVYLLDCYSEAQTRKIRKLIAGPLERIALKAAANVFVMSEKLAEYYYDRYGVESILLPHPVEMPEYPESPKEIRVRQGERKHIVFTGMIYEAQLDAIRNLVGAISNMPDVELHLYSTRSRDKLVGLGISGDNVRHYSFVEQAHAQNIQREADILFLPIAFHSPYPNIIKTASPSKIGEYLVSGRPILVHAPPYAYVTWYAKKHGWGAVVDTPDIEALRSEIQKIFIDKEYAGNLVGNAIITAKEHDAKLVAGRLLGALDK